MSFSDGVHSYLYAGLLNLRNRRQTEDVTSLDWSDHSLTYNPCEIFFHKSSFSNRFIRHFTRYPLYTQSRMKDVAYSWSFMELQMVDSPNFGKEYTVTRFTLPTHFVLIEVLIPSEANDLDFRSPADIVDEVARPARNRCQITDRSYSTGLWMIHEIKYALNISHIGKICDGYW